jgi:hypothetical protein
MLSLELLVERFAAEIGARRRAGEIVAECRSPELDRQLALAWENLKVGIPHCGAEVRCSRDGNYWGDGLMVLPKE